MFVSGILCFIACNNEIEQRADLRNQPQLGLIMPAAERASVYSSAVTSECMIDKVWVLEFNVDGTLKNSALIDGSQIMDNGRSTQLLPQLSFKLTYGNRIVCIANSDAKTYPHPNESGITLSNINTYFPLKSKGYYYGGEMLPMYGDFIWETSKYTCAMVRAVAKVQIQMGSTAPDATSGFTAENVDYKVYNGAKEGYMQPSSGAITGIPLTAPTETSERYFLLQKKDASEKERTAYFYEYPSSIQTGLGAAVADKTFDRNRLHVILNKGRGANPNDTTYYRLDFYDPITQKYLDLKRNHHYLFTINKVRSEGYSTLSQAQNNPGSNIEYTVRIDDGSQAITSNGQYAIVTSVDTVRITGDLSTPTVVATFRYIDSTGILDVTENSVSVEAGSIQPSGATLSVTAPVGSSPIKSTNEELKITTAGNLTQGVVLFKLGNITHRLYIKKP
jgi:hypothetical protein